MTTAASIPESAHPFAAAGYVGPYAFVAPHVASFQACPGAPEQAAGSCDICGTNYKYGVTFKDARGIRFRTGCDCAVKALRDYDRELAETVADARKALKRQVRDEARAEARERRQAERAAEVEREQRELDRQIVEIDMDALDKIAHPLDWAARQGKSWGDAVRYWMERNARRALDVASEGRGAISDGTAEPVRKVVTVDPERSEHVGSVKERRVFEVTMVAKIAWDGMYGTTWLCKFVDDDGNLIVWKTSSSPSSLGSEDEHGYYVPVEQGDRVTFKATVKSHDVDSYNGDAKCTYVTRAKRV